jgi:GNAT superfamily N-acetyltransferase
MRTETIYHPDMWETVFGKGEKSPRLSHFTVEHGDPLDFSPNPIINKLIQGGWEVHTTFSQFWMALPRTSLTLGTPFVMEERQEFQIDIKDVGFLRFRFEKAERVYLTLFMVKFEKQGKGFGKQWFPLVIDALFRAGVKYVWGRVEPPFYRVAWPMDSERLIRFYERQGFLNCGDERIWRFSPHCGSDHACTGDTATANAHETAAVLQSCNTLGQD